MDLDTFKELLNAQQSAYRDATAMLFDSLNKRIEDQNSKLYELQKSLEFSQEELRITKTELSTYKKEFRIQAKQMEEFKTEITTLTSQMARQEDYSRRKNIRIKGVEEENQENWEQTQFKVDKLMKEKMELQNVKIEYAHRINKKTNKPGPRTIVARLSHDTDKSRTMKNSHKLKGTRIFINEDLSERALSIRKEKLAELKLARAHGKIAYFDKDKLVIKDRNQDSERQLRRNVAQRPDEDINNSRVSTLVSVFDSSPLPSVGDSTSNITNDSGAMSPVSSRLRARSDISST